MPSPAQSYGVTPGIPAPPQNDNIAAAIQIDGVTAALAGNLQEATLEEGEPRPFPVTYGQTLWWEFTAPGTGTSYVRNLRDRAAPFVGVFEKGSSGQMELVAHSAMYLAASTGDGYSDDCVGYWSTHHNLEWDVLEGHTYEIAIDGLGDMGLDMAFEMTFEFTPAPSNDHVEGATHLAGDDLTTTASTLGATRSGDEPFIPKSDEYVALFSIPGSYHPAPKLAVQYSNSGSSIWFDWTPTSSGVVQISADEPNRYDDPDFTIIEPRNGSGGGLVIITVGGCGHYIEAFPPVYFTPTFSIFESTSPGWSLLRHYALSMVSSVEANKTYAIAVDGLNGGSGETEMHLLLTPPPPNDRLENRIQLPSEELSVSGRTFAATGGLEEVEHHHADQAYQNFVWWEWSAPSPGLWGLSIEENTNDDLFVIYEGTIPEEISALALGSYGQLIFETTTTNPILIGIGSGSGFGGRIRFKLLPASHPQLTYIKQLSGVGSLTEFRLRFESNRGFGYELETSSNLEQWEPVGISNGRNSKLINIHFDSPSPTRFFRTRLFGPAN